VPVARWLGQRLAEPGQFEAARERSLPSVGSWPKAARFDGDRRTAVAINSFPTWDERAPLCHFLRYPGKPLSARATRGFLSRTDRAKLRFPEGFRERLREHLQRMESQEQSAIEPLVQERGYAIAAE
jgi:DNA (cytosine-5)-methyltransferase 1